MKSVLFAAAAAVALSACARNEIDPANVIIRNGPQTQSPWADAPNGKLPEAGATVSAAAPTPVIIDDSASSTGSIFE